MRLLLLFLLTTLAVKILAEPQPNRARDFIYQTDDETRMDRVQRRNEMLNSKSDDPSGRLLMRKFFLNNIFGHKKQPIITAGGNGDAPTKIDTPTTSDITSPLATTTISDPLPANPVETPETANPDVSPANPANPPDPSTPTDNTNPIRRFELYELNDEDDVTVEAAASNGELNSPNGAEEFFITGQKVKTPARINLRLRGGSRDQVITISLPAKYRSYLKNGQRVVLQGHQVARPAKRRIIRRRKNRRRTNKNKKNKRRRFVTG